MAVTRRIRRSADQRPVLFQFNAHRNGMAFCGWQERKFWLVGCESRRCRHQRGRATGLDRHPHLWRHRRLFGKMDRHARTPLRTSRRTDPAMKGENHRGSACSSRMEHSLINGRLRRAPVCRAAWGDNARRSLHRQTGLVPPAEARLLPSGGANGPAGSVTGAISAEKPH